MCAKLCIYGGSAEGGNRNPEGGIAEAEERRAAGRRIGPEAVTEHETGFVCGDTRMNATFPLFLGQAIVRQSDFI